MSESLHTRILEEIRSKIVDGEWPPGHQLDKETELAAQYGVSRMTMNKVLTELSANGFITRRKRRGTFVAKARAQSAVMEINNIADEVAALGRRYDWKLLSQETRTLGQNDLRVLGVRQAALRDMAIYLQGVHYADDEPFCLETRAINLTAVPDAATVDFSHELPGAWLLHSMPWSNVRHSVRAINISGRDAHQLRLPVGAACLEILRKTQINDDWITYARLLYPGEAHQLTAEFGARS
ncbi:UTRA domain-containing protein [Nitratireductor sp. GISD-1A_MAKvit]|uniref:UTRA domain-containing protein n=1 Tax=Nitratireductor sp. GISD-1A_MAKvit TaxID=3234198 RepID=UPI003466E958